MYGESHFSIMMQWVKVGPEQIIQRWVRWEDAKIVDGYIPDGEETGISP
jgi:hypothetical protein